VERPTEVRPQPVLVLIGPTGVGKTAISLEVAERLGNAERTGNDKAVGAEIISADSRAFFSGLEIVTDKPSAEARGRIPHHLLDIVTPFETYDAMTFRRDVARLVPAIAGRGRVPMLVGGGTLYVGAVLRGLFEGPSKDDALRARLAKEELGALRERLRTVDPAAARSIHTNDRLRITRALEVYELTGRPISSWHAEADPLPYAFHGVGLQREREDHRSAIATRVRSMIEAGLFDEIARLRSEGLAPQHQAYRTIGVPEGVDFLEGRATADETEQALVHRTWALARRQTAWFRRDEGVSWVNVTGRSPAEVAEEIVKAWRRFTEAIGG